MPIVVKIPEKVKAGGAKGHCYRDVSNNIEQTELTEMAQENVGVNGQGELFKRRRGQIPDAERVTILQEKLYHKAKQEREYKFFVLYDKMFIPYMLRQAWEKVKENAGAPGVDRITIDWVKEYGVDRYLQELGEELRKRTYKPQAVKRVMIDKADGSKRPLGIPVIRDRIAQTVCKMILEPIFEADFEGTSHGFRPGRSSKGAMTQIKKNLEEGKTEVYDADLSKYFDTIPHEKLMIALKQRISDPRILKLIYLWLKVPVYEDGKYTSGKGNKQGTPQGGVISPLLANIYLNLLDKVVNDTQKTFGKHGISIVRYADDFVLMGEKIPSEVIEKLKTLLQRMGLTLNEKKTRQIDAQKESFDFLGFTLRFDKDIRGKEVHYWNIIPSKKSELKVRQKVLDYLRRHGHSNAQDVAYGINSIIRGWLDYFIIPKVSYPAMSKRRLRNYLFDRLYRYYNRKSQRKCRLFRQDAFSVLQIRNGLIDPTKYAPVRSLAHL